MATKRTKKTAAKKPTEENAPQPMDPDAVEAPAGAVAPVVNRQRLAYALDTLIKEVLKVFPETTYEVSGYNAFNAALHVAFHPDEFERVAEVLSLVKDDVRVEEVLIERDDHTILVALHPNLRLQDLRDSFGIEAAWDILSGEYGDAGEGLSSALSEPQEDDK